jgi:hypothetical protein
MFKKLSLISLAAVIVFCCAGCTKPTAQETLNNAMKKMISLKTISYNIKLGLFGSLPDLTSNNILALGKKDGRVIFSITGQSNLEKMLHSLNVNANYKLNDQYLNANLALINTAQTLYITLKDDPKLPGLNLASLINKCYKFDYAKFQQLTAEKPAAAPLDEKTADKIRALAGKTNFLAVAGELGAEELNGAAAQHFVVKLNEKETQTFFEEATALINAAKMSAQEKADLAKNLAEARKIQADIWVNENDNLIHRVELNYNLTDPQFDISRIDLAADFFDFNKKSTISIPKQTFEFNDLITSFLK